MKIILMMVTSANGKITNGFDSNVTHWTSKEDQDVFAEAKRKHTLIVMGSRTYEENIHRIKPTKNTLRIVLTKNPGAFDKMATAGQLEFTSESPDELVERLEKLGYAQMLLTGGSEVATSFLLAKLVDELYLTIEPKLFGSGKNIFADSEFSATMQLIKMKQLNSRGTLHLVYKILK